MKLQFIILYLFSLVCLYLYLDLEKNEYINSAFSATIEERKTAYDILHNSFKRDADIIFNLKIKNDKEIIDIYEKLQKSSKEETDILRVELYKLFKDDYEMMKKNFHIHHIHFHLSNNHSFLRVHKPDKFGDDLTDVRNALVIANKNSSFVSGYEVGRTTGAYRFIYPLKNTHNQHLGTVEISFGAREFVKAFIDTFKQPANVHFSKEILYKKSWEEFIDKNYNKLPFSDMYAEKSIQLLLMNYFENNQYQQLDVSKEFAIDLQRSIKNNLEHKTIVKYNETLNQVFVFLPIINPITKEFIGYFSTRSGADQITHTYSNFYIKFLFFALLIATVLYLAYKKLLINTNKNKILDSKIDKQKQELERRENIISKYVIYSRTNPKGIITDASEAFCELSGYTKEELVGNPHNIIRHPDVSSKVFEGMWANLKAEKPWEGEVLNKAKDQTDYWVYSKVSPEYDYDGNLIGYISVRNDITARKDYEKQQSFMQEQSKMAAMGDMIGNIAHQWRQPLTTIATKATGSIFQKEMGLLSDEVFHDNMESINESAQYLSQTIDIFRNFIRGSGEIVHVNVKKEIEDSFKIVEGSLKNYHITLNEYFEDGDFIVESKEGELVQVVINILNNAKDALLEKKIENPIIDIKLQKQNQQAIITIEDNAGGIPKDVLPKIFEPYFTTKHQSQGTGLGLQMSYEIITNSFHGKLYAKNTEKGAKFFIELPLMDLGY